MTLPVSRCAPGAATGPQGRRKGSRGATAQGIRFRSGDGKTVTAPVTTKGKNAGKLCRVTSPTLKGRPAGASLWPGNWWKKGAEMLRIDLDAAGIPYAVEGPDGPLYADFHALRHSYIALLEKSGATLKEAMQLAQHSDPKLTMAVYGRAQLHDLGRAVERLPDLMAGPEATAATGTDGAAAGSNDKSARRIPLPYSPLTGVADSGGEPLRLFETPAGGDAENVTGPNPVPEQRVAADGDSLRPNESSSPTRTRTWNKPVNSRLLYH